MKVDHVLILAAGKGTRMGEIGKTLPKVIWPIFGKSLLELEVAYAKSIAPEAKIYINLFNQKETIKKFIRANSKSFSDVEVLEEREVLDIGGAIHNLACNVDYKGNLLVLNGDQFLHFSETVILDGLEKLMGLDSLLYTYTVNSNDGYNALDIKDNHFNGVILNDNLDPNQEVETYTGMSLIKLNKLKRVRGESKFFTSIANHKENEIGLERINSFEYWDFGTLSRYHKSIYELLESKDSSFYKFLQKAGVFSNFESLNDLLEFNEFKVSRNSIVYRDIVEKLVD
jgi:mannose-1-phosphate guanylyltransferase